MAAVLQPLNVKAADIIVNHVDLLQTPYIDPLLLQVLWRALRWLCRLLLRLAAPHRPPLPEP